VDFRDLKKKLAEFSVRAPGSEQTRKLQEHLKQCFTGYEHETVDFKSPQHTSPPHRGGSLGLTAFAGSGGAFPSSTQPAFVCGTCGYSRLTAFVGRERLRELVEAVQLYPVPELGAEENS